MQIGMQVLENSKYQTTFAFRSQNFLPEKNLYIRDFLVKSKGSKEEKIWFNLVNSPLHTSVFQTSSRSFIELVNENKEFYIYFEESLLLHYDEQDIESKYFVLRECVDNNLWTKDTLSEREEVKYYILKAKEYTNDNTEKLDIYTQALEMSEKIYGRIIF